MLAPFEISKKHLFYFLFLITIVGSLTHFDYIQHVRYAPPPNQDYFHICKQSCTETPNCHSFQAYPNEESQGLIECFLYDERFNKLVEAFPDVTFARPGMINGSVTNDIDIRRQFANPLVTDANVFTNTEQHFVRGCSYTISLWSWLYKPSVLPDHELDIFTTRESEGVSGMFIDEALLPAIVFNVGGAPDVTNRFFFSATKDDVGNYHGFWVPNEVRYHEWVHLAMTVTEDSLTAYINGEIAGAVIISPPRRGNKMYCPYNRAPIGPHTPAHSKNPAIHIPESSSIKSIQDPISLAPYLPSEAINNTILQVGGVNRGILPTTAGMFMDLVVIRNAAASPERVKAIMNQRRPPRSTTLYKLLRAFGKYSLQDYSVLEIKGYYNGYRQKAWGLCPEAVCGLFSLSEEFHLGPPNIRAKRTIRRTHIPSLATTPIALPEESEENYEDEEEIHDSYIEYDEDDAYGYEALPGQEYGTGEYLADDMYVEGDVDPDMMELLPLRETAGFPDAHTDLFPKSLRDGSARPGSGGKRSYMRRRLVPQIQLLRQSIAQGSSNTSANATSSSWSSVFSFHSLKAVVEGSNGTILTRTQNWAHSVWILLRTTASSIISSPLSAQLYASGSSSEVDGENSSADVDTASELYHTAILLLNDRHTKYLNTSIMPLPQWRRQTLEHARAYLSLSLWLANEDAPSQITHGWNFRFAPPLSQPILLALAFINGFDSLEEMYLPSDLGSYMGDSLSGGNLYSLLNLTHGSNFDALFVLNQILGESALSADPLLAAESGMEAVVGSTGLASDIADTHQSGSLFSHAATAVVANSGSLFDADGELHSAIRPWIALLMDSYLDSLNVSTRPISSYSSTHATSTAEYIGRIREAVRVLDSMRREAMNRKNFPQSSDQSTAYLHRDRLAIMLQLSTFGRGIGLDGSGLDPYGYKTENECRNAAAYYFPVSQYVTSNFGLVETGVGLLEDIRLSIGAYHGQGGADDELQLHNEAEALAGNTEAQMWLGRRYFWGYGGLQPNVQQARHWFERAAEQGNAEGLYNVGVFHNNGQGGLPVNPQLAMDFFIRAANAPVPFPMAVHAVGQYYLRHETGQQNLTKARDYFQKAAELNSADGHFSLAMMYREGSAGSIDVPLCIIHLSLAIQLGHVRASNFLAHALLDPEGWFYQYGKEVEVDAKLAKEGWNPAARFDLLGAASGGDLLKVKQAIAAGANVSVVDSEGRSPLHLASGAGWIEIVRVLIAAGGNVSQGSPYGTPVDAAQTGGHSDIAQLLLSAQQQVGSEEELPKIWVYNESLSILIHLPTGSLALPVPLGRGNTCPIALQLLKSVAENSYRPNDLSKNALSSYLEGNLWEALDFYDEAASLGIQNAMENSAWLYEQLQDRECGTGFLDGLEARAAEWKQWLIDQGSSMLGGSNMTTFNGSASIHGDQAMLPDSNFLPAQSKEECQKYFHKMSARRWMQLAHTGDHIARREVARRYADSRTQSNIRAVPLNATQAGLLYALSSEQGDVHSTVALAWLFTGVGCTTNTTSSSSGRPSPGVCGQEEGSSIARNLTAARGLFLAALEMEAKIDHGEHSMHTTSGAAGQIGLLYLSASKIFSGMTDLVDESGISSGDEQLGVYAILVLLGILVLILRGVNAHWRDDVIQQRRALRLVDGTRSG